MGTAAAAAVLSGAKVWEVLSQPRARVCTLSAPSYAADLVDLLIRGIREYPETVARFRGGRVVLKPNLVEFEETRPINTHPAVVGAAIEAFLRLGAREVVVAEGPGHRRDTELMLSQSGLGDVLSQLGTRFVDLNVDVAAQIPLMTSYTGLASMPIAATVMGADLVVSVAKMKTHHWAGATLSMKNLFGTVPGVAVGWPKNPLHWAGIDKSIVDLWLAIRPGFAIVDGIVAMEGDGPIRGTPIALGCLVLGDQCAAVDSTAARLMGLDPHRLAYLDLAMRSGGTVSASRIESTGDRISPRRFAVLPQFAHLYIEK